MSSAFVIGSVVSAGVGLYEANQQQNMAQTMFNQANPFGPYRPQFAQQLSTLMANPSSIVNTPGYKFGLDQGTSAVNRSNSQIIGSGNQGIALEQYGQNYAMGFLNQQEQMLANLSGANITPANAAQAASVYSNASGQVGNSLATLAYGLRYGQQNPSNPGSSFPTGTSYPSGGAPDPTSYAGTGMNPWTGASIGGGGMSYTGG